ncbi:MAG: FAD:protein FMN transferase [Bacteroidota bacterium]
MIKWIWPVVIVVVFSACDNSWTREPVKVSGKAQGTYYAVTYFDKKGRDFKPQIDSLLTAFDMTASVYKPNSVISKINNNESRETDAIFRDIFRAAASISQQTEGAFDVTVMPLVNAWGFGYEDPEELEEPKVDSLLQYIGYNKVWLDGKTLMKALPEVKVDFNSIAQGYSVDLIGSFLEGEGIENYLVDVGGEVLAKGKKPGKGLWKVGIEKPAESSNSPRTVKAVVSLKNRALATSGTYRKYYERDGVRYSHTINPKTGYPVDHTLLSVSVMAPNAMLADAYATAFMVMGLQDAREFLKNQADLDGYFIYSNENGKMRTYATGGMRRFMDTED